MKRDEIIDILQKNKDNIERGNWEKVYETIVNFLRGQFTDFLIENGLDPNTLFNKYIPDCAFYQSKLLTSINIGNSITKIEDGAFRGCQQLESINLPNNLIDIGDVTFAGCESLTSITIPNKVTKIGDDAFYHCQSLTEIKYEGTEEDWRKIQKGFNWNNNCPAKITFLR